MLMDKDPNAIKKSIEFMSTTVFKEVRSRRSIIEEGCTEGAIDVNRVGGD
jgi:hypothetical protein